MTRTNTTVLSRIPSLRALWSFSVAGHHLNLVRAAEELHITQSALSRQIKGLEEHLGVQLFERGPRGLRFTQEGEMLHDYAARAFRVMDQGVSRLTITASRHTVVVSVARSFAERVLAHRVGHFALAHPDIDLQIDVHRYFADLESSGADVSIRLGAGDWQDYESLRLTDDALMLVCAPAIARQIQQGVSDIKTLPLIRNRERDYFDTWVSRQVEGDIPWHALPTLNINDSAVTLSAVESGVGLTVTRTSLAAHALEQGTLVPVVAGTVRDGLNYFAVSSRRTYRASAVRRFMDWLAAELRPGDNGSPSSTDAAS